MKKIIWSIFLLSIQTALFGHDPLSAFHQLNVYQNHCLLSINLSQYGTEQAIIKAYPELNLNTVDPNDFKELLISYVKKNVVLTFNNQRIELGKGAIKLGSHQTDLKFEIPNTPSLPFHLNAKITSFEQNENHKNFLKVVNQKNHLRVKLSANNHFEQSFSISESAVVPYDRHKNDSQSTKILLFIGTPLILGIVYFSMQWTK